MINEFWSTLTPPEQIYWWGNICLVAGFLVSEIISVIAKRYRDTHGSE